jgi:hypothetical protein
MGHRAVCHACRDGRVPAVRKPGCFLPRSAGLHQGVVSPVGIFRRSRKYLPAPGARVLLRRRRGTGFRGTFGRRLRPMLLDDTVLPTDILLADGSRAAHDFSGEELREASRALRGSPSCGRMPVEYITGRCGTPRPERQRVGSKDRRESHPSTRSGPLRSTRGDAHPQVA